MKLVNKKEIKKPQETYNLHIEQDHNYIANDAVVSNCHQAKAEVLKNLLTRNLRNAPIRWGLTGTIPKEAFEFESLHASIGPVIGQISAKELQDKGVLAECHVNVVQLLDTVEHRDYQAELKYLVTNEDRIEYIAKLLNSIKQTGNTLILVDRIAAGEKLQALIPNSSFVKGDVKLKARKEAYDEINEGTNHVVIATYGVAAVGINIPRIFNLVLIEPGKSFVRVIQSIGRGVRKAKDKDFVQIWDITSTCKFAKRHLTQRKKFYSEARYPFSVEKVDWQK
jgi:superfamily II DNA or RNA helicase